MYISPLLSFSTFFKSLFYSSSNRFHNFEQFSYARGSILIAIFSIIKSKKNINKKVLVPAYICDTVIFLLEEYKIDFDFYKVNKDLTIDVEYLKKIHSKNSILLLVNYFGFKMMTSDLNKFLIENKISLIQDFAHSMIIDLKNNINKIEGDAVIFGLRKIFVSVCQVYH